MTLYLLPNLLSDELPWEPFLPVSVKEAVLSLQGLIAESEKAGRRFLKRFLTHERLAAMPIKLLNEHTLHNELEVLFAPMKRGEVWGLVSDAGIPCLADPGAALVRLAHKHQLPVVAFPGPSSPILALQLSGLNGQSFSFHGYLPREPDQLQKALKKLEKRSHEDKATQIWIEAPYRSARLAQTAMEVLKPQTLFCIALNLTMPDQRVRMQKIEQWKKTTFPIEKEPAVFLMLDIDS